MPSTTSEKGWVGFMQTETINRKATRAKAVACPIFLARGTSTIPRTCVPLASLLSLFPEHSNVLYSSFKMPTVYFLLVCKLHGSRCLSFIHWCVPSSSNSEWVVHGRCSVYLFLFVCLLPCYSFLFSPHYFLLIFSMLMVTFGYFSPQLQLSVGGSPKMTEE